MSTIALFHETKEFLSEVKYREISLKENLNLKGNCLEGEWWEC